MNTLFIPGFETQAQFFDEFPRQRDELFVLCNGIYEILPNVVDAV